MNRTKKGFNRNETRWAYLFISAPVLQFLIFLAVPLCFAIYASFTNWNILDAKHSFIGLNNYKEMFLDEKFWKAFANTAYILMAVPIYMFISLLLALGFNSKVPGDKVFRVIYYLPSVSSIVALSVMWRWLFNSEFGLVNNFLSAVLNIEGPNWLYDPKWIKLCIVLMIIWKMIGVSAIYYLAALQNIPGSYYEAALMDGATGFKKFWYITLPMLTPISFYLLVVYLIGSLQTVIEVYMLTPDGLGGQDYAAGTVVHYIWNRAFTHYDMGYASGVALIFLLVVMTVTLLQFKLSDKWVYEGN